LDRWRNYGCNFFVASRPWRASSSECLDGGAVREVPELCRISQFCMGCRDATKLLMVLLFGARPKIYVSSSLFKQYSSDYCKTGR